MFAAPADADGDGRVDVFVGAKESGVAVVVLRAPPDARDGGAWTLHPISSAVEDRWVMSLVADDVDGDGADDLVLTCEDATAGRSGVFYVPLATGEA